MTAEPDVSQRVADSAALRVARLALALEANRLGTWDWDIVSDRIVWGGYHYQLFGLEQEQFDGTYEAFLSSLVPEDREAVQKEIVRITSSGGEDYCQEYRTIWPDGSERCLEGRARFFYDNTGRPVRMVGVVRDITDQKNAQRAMERRELELRQLADTLPQLVWVTRPDGFHEWYNRRWYEYTGATYEQSSGEQWSDFFHPDDIQTVQERWRHSLRTGETYDVEYRCRRYDGEWRWFLGRAQPIRDASGAIARWFGTCTDIHDQKEAASRLREQERWLEVVLDRLPTPVILLEPGTARVVFSNSAANELAGGNFPKDRAAEEYPKVYSVYDSEGRVLSADEMPGVRLARGEELHDLEVDWDTAGGRRSLLIQGTTLPPLHGRDPVALSSFQDITRLKAIEHALRRSNDDLERFAYLASHDLQEPLRMVTIYSQLLKRKLADSVDETTDKYLAFIQEGTERMARIIQDLLVYSRFSGGGKLDLLPTDANVALHMAQAALRSQIDDVRPVLTWDHLPTLPAAESLLAQVFQNLLGNAMKYARAGIRPEIHVSASLRDGHWVFSVRDNGQGIAPEHSERVFQLFSRLHDREVSGTGIGLAICKRIVERHGGRIWLESVPGEGSTFFFCIPAA